MSPRAVAQVVTCGTLLDWSEWIECKPPFSGYRGRLPWRMSRNRRLVFGPVEGARIIEYAMQSGPSQFILSYNGAPNPYPRFDTYAQAYALLQELFP